MSSREDILASIRQHTQTRYDKPDIADMKRLSYPDKIEQFCAISRAVGGTAYCCYCHQEILIKHFTMHDAQNGFS